MRRSLAVVVNPTSGGGRGARWGARVVQAIHDHGLASRVVIGFDAEDVARRGRQVLGSARRAPDEMAGIVAVGGDGLVHLALQLAIEHDLPLGVIPAGTGNDFARAAGLRTVSPEQAVQDIVRALDAGDLPTADVGQILDGPMFGCVLSAGFDATVNARANRFTRVRGRARYPLAMMAELRRFDPLVCTLEVDGVRTTHDAMLIAIGNGSSYGGGMRICPDASLTDGWLDVTVVEEISVLELLRLFPTVYSGRHLQHPAARSYRGRSVTVEFTGDQLPPLFADGEPMSQHLAGGGCTAVVRPGALRLLTSRLT